MAKSHYEKRKSGEFEILSGQIWNLKLPVLQKGDHEWRCKFYYRSGGNFAIGI